MTAATCEFAQVDNFRFRQLAIVKKLALQYLGFNMNVRAKFSVTSLIPGYGGNVSVGLSAIYASKTGVRAEENKAFSDVTPSGQINIVIAPDKPALQAFEIGKEFYVDFTPA